MEMPTRSMYQRNNVHNRSSIAYMYILLSSMFFKPYV